MPCNFDFFITETASEFMNKHAKKHTNMTDSFLDHDSAFGDDDFLHMFSPPVLAGAKRDAGDFTAEDSASLGPNEYLNESVLCCDHCPEPCPEARSVVRPSKRRASPQDVSAYHNLTAESHPIDPDSQFPDDCFEKFCQECNLDAPCPPECALPCPVDTECSTPDPCCDPHCDTKEAECVDGCVDPDCTKLSCPDKTCFCQKCDVQPCPLGDPTNDCHFAHTEPTTTGTIYCFDSAPCHFQEGLHNHNNDLSSFETYPCFSPTHGYMNSVDTATQTSSAQTPVLSHSNFTSLESVFSGESSPGPTSFANCFLGASADHCHIDNSCCHGSKRACGDCPSASPRQLDLWNSSMAQGNALANNFMNFGLLSNPNSPLSATPYSNNLDSSMLGFNDNSWMFVDPSIPTTFQPEMIGVTKLDFLACAVQQDLLMSTSALPDGSMKLETNAIEESLDTQQCVCRWYVCLDQYASFCSMQSTPIESRKHLEPPQSLMIPAGNSPPTIFVSLPSPPLKPYTSTSKLRTSTTAPPASATGSLAMPPLKTSSSAPSSRGTCSATQGTGRTPAATHPAPRRSRPIKPKITTSVPTRANAPTSATAAATRRRRTRSSKHTLAPYTTARNRTPAASATLRAQTAVI
jgi:hypothetical protein